MDFFDAELSARAIALSEISIPEESPVIGKTLAELGIPKKFGVSVVAISQSNRLWANPDPSVKLEAGGQIIIFGEREKALRLRRFVSGAGKTPHRIALPSIPFKKPLLHEIRVRGPRMMTNILLIVLIMVLNQLISPVSSAAGLTINLQPVFNIAIFVAVWAAIFYLLILIQILSDFRVLVDLGVLRATGLSSYYEARGVRRLVRNLVLITTIIVLGAFVSPLLGSLGGLAVWVGGAIPWLCLGLLLVVLYDVGSFIHSTVSSWVRKFVDGLAHDLEEAG